MTDRDDHRAFVDERWSDLAVESFEPLGDGWDCFTYLANGVFSGFAGGFGFERSAMMKHHIDDIRLFFADDLRFLEQFGA